VKGNHHAGEEVWGSAPNLGIVRDGSHAEYVAVPAETLSLKPHSLTMAQFEAQKQEWVNLAHEIPVLILYGTAIVKEDGQVFFFEDIYGYDNALANLFAQAYASKN